jgi:rSAM/selenodomain-associated transferase 1
MDMSRVNGEIAIAILAKAPIAGAAKTRLIPALGPEGAARLQERLLMAAVQTALQVGTVTLWAAPDSSHPAFQQFAPRVRLACQPSGDLGARMLEAIAAADCPVLVMGTDCPILTADHLRRSADLLHDGIDVVVTPAEDGGYVLIGMRTPEPRLFSDMVWSTPTVMMETRRRLACLNLSWREPARLWDVDVPRDLQRMQAENLAHLLQE